LYHPVLSSGFGNQARPDLQVLSRGPLSQFCIAEPDCLKNGAVLANYFQRSGVVRTVMAALQQQRCQKAYHVAQDVPAALIMASWNW